MTVRVETVPPPGPPGTKPPGEPIEGVGVWLSLGTLPRNSAHLSSQGIAGAPNANPMHFGETDAEGHVVFAGLTHGTSDVALADRTLLRRGWQTWSLVELEQPEQKVVLQVAPLAAAVVRFSGDELAYAVTKYGRRHMVSGQERNLATFALQERFPDTHVSVAAVASEDSPVAQIHAMFVHKGLLTFDVVLDPLDSVVEQVIDVSSHTDRHESGKLRLRVADAAGREIEGIEVLLYPRDLGDKRPFPHRAGETITLPAGHYEAQSFDRVAVFKPLIVTVAVGETRVEEIEATRSCVVVHLAVRGPRSETPRAASLKFTQGKWWHTMSCSTPDRCPVVLPLGEVEVETFVLGHGTRTTTLNVGPETTEFVLPYGRN